MGSDSRAIEIEVPVFIDTSLGTRIAISVSPHLTAAEFKRKFESIHSDCYPGIGNIKVNGLMIKKKSYFYHLPESMPIKHAFQGSKGTWFLYTEAYPLNKKIPSTPQSQVVVHNGLSRIKKRENEHKQGSDAYSFESVSVSVSGIIKKYFSVYDEVTSVNPRPQVPKYAPETPPTVTSVRSLKDLRKCSGVGNGVILAANNLGASSNKKRVISLCKDKCDKSSSHVRHPVFEIGE
ncbi:uncharacterized protein LOC111907970 [Lactuca sativa]|uniref:Uncharacterized protein n=1 Tax=Lactuca sativa TaxID=4236 RepID=A0A9R1V076_LACSA|nr:uncharacterized protein LOC111907970 [Lactuca sativa]KAJ0197270.1 hypothetical protein LSAT_V11C700387650 [Lactuca sativa]